MTSSGGLGAPLPFKPMYCSRPTLARRKFSPAEHAATACQSEGGQRMPPLSACIGPGTFTSTGSQCQCRLVATSTSDAASSGSSQCSALPAALLAILISLCKIHNQTNNHSQEKKSKESYTYPGPHFAFCHTADDAACLIHRRRDDSNIGADTVKGFTVAPKLLHASCIKVRVSR